MNEIVKSSEQVLRNNDIQKKHQHYLNQAISDNTRRAYQSAIRQFEKWSGLLPADENSVVKYLIDQADLINPRTLTLHLTAISNWHKCQNFYDPTSTSLVRKTLEGIKRSKGKPKQKAEALQLKDLKILIKKLYCNDDLKSLRDNAIIQISYFGAFRRSELVNIKVEDLTFKPEGLLIQLQRSKTDQTGKGKIKALPFGNGDYLCPVKAIKKWVKIANINSGFIFRSINRWSVIKENCLNSASINLILKSRAKECNFDFADKLSSHSLRRGLATSAANMGATFESIKRQGGWENDNTVREYIEEGCLFNDNAADVLLKYKGFEE